MKEKHYKAILADLDGTVNRGNVLIDGVCDVYNDLSGKGFPWLFLSNNASSLAVDLARKIRGLGIPAADRQVLNSATALIHTVQREYRNSHVMVIGQPRLIEGLEQAGAIIENDPLRTDIVLTAMDRGFTYEKLTHAHIALQHGAYFWATNLDATFPVADGFRPGAGSIAAAVAAVAGRPPDRVFGKPSPDMAWIALELLELPAESCLVVGDRMETDILFARNAGMASALVLTGASSRSDIAMYDYRPDHVLESIVDVGSLLD
jgi:HAD superfamily hydrolase (TIGR01450 family)